MPLSATFRRMIRGDFLSLLRDHRARSTFRHGTDQRLARDLHDLGGLLGEW